ncbi:MAG TPA: hypothetical protein VMJ12_11870 [Candidatus Acidoferrales bacterium]|nr:hypothetical protein [Candidatus Acidoferrales bacterium]
MSSTCHQWGKDLDANARQQMENACRLPVSVAAALMPDAHVGSAPVDCCRQFHRNATNHPVSSSISPEQN